jgi:rod shape-determining protein MreC
MKWIRKHKLITSILSLLVVLASIFVVSVVSGTGSNLFSASINTGVTGVTGFFSSIGVSIRDGVSGFANNINLQNKIDELQEENAQLQRELAQEKLNAIQLEQLTQLAGLLNYDYTDETFNVVTADISLRDESNWLGIFTIDRGTEAGIKDGSIVIDGDGLVGRVYETGQGWSKVIPVIDEDVKVSFKLARDGSQLGIAYGNGEGIFEGYMLDESSTVEEGDILITTGMGIYPGGIQLGVVKSVSYNSDRLMKEITVEPVVDFNGLRKVAVVI